MLDFTDFRFFLANITTIRLMDANSEEVKTAIYDWRQSERRHKGFSDIYADQIKTHTALFYDAVTTFLTTFRESNAVRTIRSQQLHCNQPKKWDQGLELMADLDQVFHKLTQIFGWKKRKLFHSNKTLLLITENESWYDWSNSVRRRRTSCRFLYGNIETEQNWH